ncbi:DUF1287 domain-containing protein [Asticcacaulis biprosthecium]|uniref:DUF1287 domain-containing protein n=1 Tax=Asticcacaulis biprosthecium TaxID=76891 RepID=UPI0003160B28|nr:DUF1287 domain-containing protein [Asticcacaulis biprosthecium]
MDRRALILALPVLGAFPARADTPAQKLVAAVREQTRHRVTYDGAYTRIPYPMGDVAADRGVCTDVVIRGYRTALGIDLQQKVHEDMKAHFALYPKAWGLKRADSNIDHRRVPNLRVFFKRFGTVRPVGRQASDYAAGDLVTYNLPGNLPHIAVVTDPVQHLIVHNIGAGPKEERALFGYDITGHFQYGL